MIKDDFILAVLTSLKSNIEKKRNKAVNENDVGRRERLQASSSRTLAAAAGGAASPMQSCLGGCWKTQPWW